MASSPRKRSSPTIANDGKAFARPVEEEISVIIKWQDDILKDPLTIKDNVKEEERNSLDIKWQDDILKDPLSIKDEGEYIIELCVISLLSLVLFYGLVGLLAGLCVIYNDNI